MTITLNQFLISLSCLVALITFINMWREEREPVTLRSYYTKSNCRKK